MTPIQRSVLIEAAAIPGTFTAHIVGASGSALLALARQGFLEVARAPVVVDSIRGGGRQRVLCESLWRVTDAGKAASQ
jgi:hypothetical protein